MSNINNEINNAVIKASLNNAQGKNVSDKIIKWMEKAAIGSLEESDKITTIETILDSMEIDK